jgi:hypothetical protein
MRGIGFLYGEQDLPFDQVKNRFLGMALYMPFILTEIPDPDMPKVYHGIRSIFDGRLGRHQILAILSANSDAPLMAYLIVFDFPVDGVLKFLKNNGKSID